MPPSSIDPAGAPELSVILATDTWETIEPVLERLRRQSVAARLEVVLVTPAVEEISAALDRETVFAATRAVRVGSLSPLGAARATGIRASAAPLVFVGETHSYPQPGWGQALIAAAAAGPWDSVTPGFGNANPQSLLSWAGFLADYGRWEASLPAGEIPEAPLYNALYRREALLGLGEDLAALLSHGDGLRLALQARGHRAYFEPSARLDHLNIDVPAKALRERISVGRLIGAHRSRGWSAARRLAYAAGSPLIPIVLSWRVWRGVRQAARARRIPAATLPVIFLLNIAKAAGEALGYTLGAGDPEEEAMDHCEVRKVDFTRGGP